MISRNREAGVTVIEVLAAVTVFSLVAAGLTATTIGTTKANNLSKQMAAATALVHAKIEQLRSLDPATDPPDLRDGEHQDPLNPLTPVGGGNGFFTRRWVVTTNTPKIGLAQVVVTVSWNAPEARTVRGVTYVCKNSKCG